MKDIKKLHLFLLIFLSCLTFANTLKGEFVYDDFEFVVNNPYIKSLTNLPLYFIHKYTLSSSGHQIYRPLRTFSYALDYLIFKLNPWGFHLTNIILHSLNGILAYLLLNLLFHNPNLSFFSCLVFLLHPIQTESVAWISSRADLLFTLFFILALISFLKNRLVLSFLFFILSLFSKESAMVFPLILVPLGFLFKKTTFKKDTRFYLLFFICTIFFFFIRFLVLGSFAQREWWGAGAVANFLTVLKVFPLYFVKTLLPFRLKLIYIIPVAQSFYEPGVIAGILVVFLILILALFLFKHSKLLFFSLAWFLIPLLPVLNIFPIVGGLFSEHYLYLSCAGYSLALSFIVLKLRFLKPIFFILLCIFFLRTFERNFDWKDELSLWRSSVQATPESFKSYVGLGNAYFKMDNFPAAMREYQKAFLLNPSRAEPWVGLGNCFFKKNLFAKARLYYQKALEKDSASQEAFIGLGSIYELQNMLEEAEAMYLKAIGSERNFLQSYCSLANLYFNQRRFLEAEVFYKMALKINPFYPTALFNLANTYLTQERIAEAIPLYRRALEVEPGSAEIHYNLGIAYGKRGEIGKAVREFILTLKIKPNYMEAYNNLVVSLLASNPPRIREAKEYIEKAQNSGLKFDARILNWFESLKEKDKM